MPDAEKSTAKKRVVAGASSSPLTGADLLAMGVEQGPWIGEALREGNQAQERGAGRDEALRVALAEADRLRPKQLALHAPGAVPFHRNIEGETAEERANLAAVEATMAPLMRTPVIRAAAVMPDACPAGPVGSIPVGGVVASEGLHPGMHSADICCSMAITTFSGAGPASVLDAVHQATHFGPGDREAERSLKPSDDLLSEISDNKYLRPLMPLAKSHFGTQGDGNHFAFVGRLKSSGETALVTHHGSRGFGAKLYAKGVKLAEKHRLRLSPETLKANAWIPADTEDLDIYWSALQTVRAWTKANHFAIHDLTAELLRAAAPAARRQDRFWNEHNFVFRRSDGLFYHAKGATPAFPGWAADAGEFTLIPLNMAEPVLIARGKSAENGLGFAPHGAGRNFSRSRHKQKHAGRSVQEIFDEETKGIDARFYCGGTDISELPSAYKSAASVRAQIERFGLAEIVDEVEPHGCLMAGDWSADAPWRRKKTEKQKDRRKERKHAARRKGR